MGDTMSQKRARVAALARSRPADDPVRIAAQRELAEAAFISEMERRVAAAPPLTPEARDTLSALFAPLLGGVA